MLDGIEIPNTGTLAAKDSGYQILGTKKWSPEVNDAWIQGGIDAKREFSVTSHTEWSNFRDQAEFNGAGEFIGRGAYPKTIFLREMLQLRDAGYRFIDGKMIPPTK